MSVSDPVERIIESSESTAAPVWLRPMGERLKIRVGTRAAGDLLQRLLSEHAIQCSQPIERPGGEAVFVASSVNGVSAAWLENYIRTRSEFRLMLDPA